MCDLTTNSVGFLVQDPSSSLAHQYGFDEDEGGVVITKVDPQSEASELGIREGDLIQRVGSENINSKKEFKILGIENRIEQILANLLDNAISFSKDKQKIRVEVEKNQNDQVILRVIDQGQGFKEKKLTKIFDRFYSDRPDKFGEHSGLGLNIVKNLVELHGGTIVASNNPDKIGARVEIYFPRV